MAAPRPSRALALVLSVLSLAGLGAGCGGEETGGGQQQVEAHEAFREGLFEELAGLEYKVFITRQLNQRDPEDRAYFQGPEPPPGSTYYGVFIQVCNEGDRPERSARTMRIVDTLGEEFFPIPLPATNVFAYRPGVVQPRECLPNEFSIAAQAPAGGSLLVFELTQEATENRPLELEIIGGYDAAGKPLELAFELDI
jgi:hypothetical protein